MTTPAPAAPQPETSAPRPPQTDGGGSRPPGLGPSGPGGPGGRPGAGPRDRDRDRDRDRRGGGRRYFPRRKVCFFCANKEVVIDYKSVDGLRRYISERGRIEPRRKTGTCARHQRSLATNIKRARQVGLLPFTTDRSRNPTPVTRDR